TVDSRLTGIGLSGTTPKNLQRKILEDFRKLDCSQNVDEEAVEQCINEDSTLECCEVLSEDDIVSRVTCGSEETRNFEECPESDEESLVTRQKLSLGDALVHTEALLNYSEQEDESTPAEKMILRNLSSIIRRRVSSASVVKAYLHRIEQVNPLINAVVDQRGAEALAEARSIDELISSGEKSEKDMEREMPLLGVPFTVKEAISVAGLLFTTGVVSRRGIRATEDADVIRLLRKAGAIPIAVTNTSEQCFWMETFNNLYGRTNNPYDLRRTAGGSSGK
ncbi:Fatty-acid amide hydrolase 2, partial [Araneus ventricosus]